MKFYFVNQSCGPLFIDIVNEFKKKGLNATLITGQINELQTSLDPQVQLHKLKRYNRSSIVTRFVSWLIFSFELFFKIILSKSGSTWLVTTNPPFAPWLTFLIKFKNSKIALLVYDLYPEALIVSDFTTEQSFIYKIWDSITQYTYRTSDKIICIGDSMARYIEKRNGDLKSKIVTIPNWNVIKFDESDKSENYREIRNAVGKIHIVYSGNLGATHDFLTILETAKELSEDGRFVFSIIGEGFKKNEIKNYVRENKLDNILWEPYKPAEDVADVFQSADVFLVTLGSGAEKTSIPSKTYDAIASGAAILVIAPSNSELEHIVKSHNIGQCFKPGEVTLTTKWLKSLADNKTRLNDYKRNAVNASEYYTPENATKYVEILKST